MITAVDEAILERLVGPTAFARARAYVRHGAVRSSVWGTGGGRVAGKVQGGARDPYFVTAELTRSPANRLSSFESTCTCPVSVNCKHAVALLLADQDSSRTPPEPAPMLRLLRDEPGSDRSPRVANVKAGTRRNPAGRKGSGAAEWEAPLRALCVDDLPAGDEADPAGIGLQFEWVAPAAKPAQQAPADGAGIRIRPVVLSRTGNWVRTGVSWSRLDYFSWGRAAGRRGKEQLSVVRELLALSRVAGGRSSYGYREEVVRLEAINSRRLWDLLREARDLHLPLLVSGRKSMPVSVHDSPATVAVDVTRGSGDLTLRPQVTVGSLLVPLGSSVLVGTPAHGVAWLHRSPSEPAGTGFHLAQFDTPVHDNLRGFLHNAAVEVPGRDQERFLREFYPILRRRVMVESGDGSVELPELEPPRLVLFVRFLADHRIELVWARDGGGEEWSQGPWGGGSGGSRDQTAEDALVESVTSIVGLAPEFFELTPSGPRLAQEATLEGIACVQFVTELLPALSELTGVTIEQVGTAPDYRELDAIPVVSLGGSDSSDNDWFDLTVTVSVEGEDVPFVDLFVALVEGQTHLLLPSGSFFSLDREELVQLAQLITEARSLGDASGSTIRLNRYQASLWEDLRRLGVVTAQAGRWEAAVRALAEATAREEHAVPDGLCATLRPYQVAGFNWLAFLYDLGLGGILADDMGLGKTLQALALMCHTREQGLTQAPYLVVAPTSVVGNWASECRRFAPGLAVTTIGETTSRRGVPLATVAGDVDIVVTSYSLFRLEYDEYAAVVWAGLFLDEAQFAKNHNSQAFQRAKMLPVPFKVAMTGTPIENNLMELWSLLSITAPGLFPSPERFAEYYRVPIEKKADTERLAQLRRRVRPLMLRRTKEQVVRDLPDKQEQVLELDLNPRHKKLYQTYLQRERQKVLGLLGDLQKHRFEIFRSLTLLRQASLDGSLVDAKHATVPSTKLD
ncbi:MAG: DEAD/DEAH box helicase, partial [Acidimicrobiales bacterium]